MARRSKKEIEQLKKWAENEYLVNNLTITQVAEKVGVTRKTIKGWSDEGGWDKLKAATIISKPQQLGRIYNQINELNTDIENKEEGKRYANSKEADALKKLTAAAKDLEGELGLSEIINVSIPLLEYIKKNSYEDSQLFQTYVDDFIRTIING